MNLVPIEQSLASAVAGAIISGGQKGDPASIVKRANTALAVANGFGQLMQGNAAPGVALIGAALASSDLDPGVALAVNGIFGIGAENAALITQINSVIPGLGAVETMIAENIAAGVTAAANAEIAHYAPLLPKAGA